MGVIQLIKKIFKKYIHTQTRAHRDTYKFATFQNKEVVLHSFKNHFEAPLYYQRVTRVISIVKSIVALSLPQTPQQTLQRSVLFIGRASSVRTHSVEGFQRGV